MAQMFKLGLERSEEPEIKLPTFVGSLKKQESSRKTSTSALLTIPKPLTVWITTNYGKFFKRWEYQITLSVSWEICMQVKKQLQLQTTSQSDHTDHSLSNSVNMSLNKLQGLVMDREAWHAAVHEVTKSWTRQSEWIELNWIQNSGWGIGSSFSLIYF